jgi:hypothetical protein
MCKCHAGISSVVWALHEFKPVMVQPVCMSHRAQSAM